jgi:hypothetical protein
MTGKAITLLLLAAIVAVAAVAVVAMSSDDGPDPVVDPDDPVSDPLPKGISFDEKTGVLKSKSEVTWNVIDELKEFYKFDRGKSTPQRVLEPVTSKSITLSPGLYTITVGEDTFQLVVGGTHTNTASWKYYFNGETYDVSVTYDISISELAKITVENREYNSSLKPTQVHPFKELPQQVYVGDTARSIVKQLETRFVQIGGDMADRQSYADFLVSFAQLGIKYPDRVDDSTDKLVWGQSEYWANSLETMFFMKGDCEDSAAVACSIFKAAGYDTAMVGIPGHVAAGVVLTDFREVTPQEISKYNKFYTSFKLGASASVVETDPQDVIYYGVDTTWGQLPVGYMLGGSVDTINKSTMWWGMAGFYPVSSN